MSIDEYALHCLHKHPLIPMRAYLRCDVTGIFLTVTDEVNGWSTPDSYSPDGCPSPYKISFNYRAYVYSKVIQF